jgi:hypothetical protein
VKVFIVKGKFHHEGPEGEKRHNFTISLTSAQWVVSATPRPLYTQERDPVPTVQEVE